MELQHAEHPDCFDWSRLQWAVKLSRFNAALPDGVLLQNLAAALSLSNVDQLDTVRLTSLGYGHSHAAMGEVLRCLMSGVEEGPELGLKVVTGELQVQR